MKLPLVLFFLGAHLISHGLSLPSPPKVPVVVWSMSGCPCSAQFAWDFNATIWSDPELHAAIDFKQPFSASAKKDGTVSCFHGKKECRFETWLLCAQQQDFTKAFAWE